MPTTARRAAYHRRFASRKRYNEAPTADVCLAACKQGQYTPTVLLQRCGSVFGHPMPHTLGVYLYHANVDYQHRVPTERYVCNRLYRVTIPKQKQQLRAMPELPELVHDCESEQVLLLLLLLLT